MMDQTYLRLLVNVEQEPPRSVVLENVSGQETAGYIIQIVLAKLGMPPAPLEWCLVYGRIEIGLNDPIGLRLGPPSGTIELTLRKKVISPPMAQAPATPPGGAPSGGLPGGMPQKSERKIFGREAVVNNYEEGRVARTQRRSASPVSAMEPLPSPARSLQTRRATVRYYSRMNPDRLYPFLLVLSREMVAEIKKKHVAQHGSQAFGVAEDLPIKVEPILPGCDCYPPKIITRLEATDQTLTFRVVPRVLGRIEGAAVVVQQAHATLARIDLEVKVVKRTWVVIWGLITFLLPMLSTALHYFGLDFSSSGQGFNLYLSLAQLLFSVVSPLWLTLALAAVTSLAFWYTRPRGRDIFWDVQTDSLAEQLLQSGTWLYKQGDHLGALRSFLQAFRLGAALANHYEDASLVATHLGQNRVALNILQTAEEVLTPQGLTPDLLFIKACNHARLGNHDAAMECLSHALRKGFHNFESLHGHPDLNPLRSRPDFQNLLASLKQPAGKV